MMSTDFNNFFKWGRVLLRPLPLLLFFVFGLGGRLVAQNKCEGTFVVVNASKQHFTVKAYTPRIYGKDTIFIAGLSNNDTIIHIYKNVDSLLCSMCRPYCLLVIQVSEQQGDIVQVLPWKPSTTLVINLHPQDSIAFNYTDTFLERRYREMLNVEQIFQQLNNEDSMIILADSIMNYLHIHYRDEPLVAIFALRFWELGILSPWWKSFLCSEQPYDDPARDVLCSEQQFLWQERNQNNIPKISANILRHRHPVIIYSAKDIVRLNNIMRKLEHKANNKILNLTFICTEPNSDFCNFYIPSAFESSITVVWDSAGNFVKEVFDIVEDTLTAGFVIKGPTLMFALKDTEVTAEHVLQWTSKPTSNLCVSNDLLQLCLLTRSFRASTSYKCGIFPYINVKEKQIIDGILRVDKTKLSCLAYSSKGSSLVKYLENAGWFSYWKYVSNIDCDKEKESIEEIKQCINSP